jgi:hypothetical protein
MQRTGNAGSSRLPTAELPGAFGGLRLDRDRLVSVPEAEVGGRPLSSRSKMIAAGFLSELTTAELMFTAGGGELLLTLDQILLSHPRDARRLPDLLDDVIPRKVGPHDEEKHSLRGWQPVCFLF